MPDHPSANPGDSASASDKSGDLRRHQASAGFGTACVRNRHNKHKAVYPHREAIYPTSAFTFADSAAAMALFEDRGGGYVYGRWGNPTCDAAAEAIAELETLGTGIVAYGRLFASGMAAISSALFACATAGQSVLTQKQLYGGTDELFSRWLEPRGIGRVTADLNDVGSLRQLRSSHPELAAVYAETPSNPMLACVDLNALASWCREADLPLIVDNTFATPYAQQALALGADVVVHSTTKFLNGHGSALGGVVVAKDKAWLEGPLFDQLKLLGAVPSPFDAWLLLSGLKTLELRMERHTSNARQVADWLLTHPAVSRVLYLGHASHPDHDLAKKQMRGFGAMLSFELHGGLEAGMRLMDRVRVCTLATTLGTVDTLVQHPASMTHRPVPPAERLAAGITDGLVRMSVGIENITDILADLEQGLRA